MEKEQLAKVVNTSQLAKQFLFALTYNVIFGVEEFLLYFRKVFAQ